jgi:thiosulfate/3-mercaptopyruvate sulfurtransferase
MSWRINSVLVILFISSCQQKGEGEKENFLTTRTVVRSNYLIEAEDLQKITLHPNIKLVDFRKREDFEKEHIEGAINIWRSDIEDTSYPYKGIMASPLQIETLFSQLGISNDDTLIIYDDNGLCDAARLWWVLENYDFTQVKLLHGGLVAWKQINEALSALTTDPAPTNFQLSKTPSMKYYSSLEDIKGAIHGNTLILDTRSVDEFSGKRMKKGASKGGRIPESKLVDWSESVNYTGDKKFKSTEELSAIYSQLAAEKRDTIIVYCHSGVRSSHTTFVLTQLLNYTNVRNYDGSWNEWSYFEDLAYDQDSITTLIN